jgi:hypothetical protein
MWEWDPLNCIRLMTAVRDIEFWNVGKVRAGTMELTHLAC